MAKQKKKVEEEEIDDTWSKPVTEGPWTMSFIQRKYNPYDLTPYRANAKHYEICLEFGGREMYYYISVEGVPTFESALRYLTDEVLHIVEVIGEKKFKEPTKQKKMNTYDVATYDSRWETYTMKARALKALVGEEIYKSIIS